MKREVGLWIDHHKTVIITLTNDTEETREIRSNIEKHLSLISGVPAKQKNLSGVSTAEDMVDRRYMNHLIGYYDGVVSLLRNADAIFIFGPGEAKLELQKRLQQHDLGARIVLVETVGKMTNRQIVARVRQQFHLM